MLYLKLARYIPDIIDIFSELAKALSKDSDGGKKITKDELEKIKLVAVMKLDVLLDDIMSDRL